jgi:hypothetical protein
MAANPASNINSPMPDTALAAAYMRALARWAERHASTGNITLPTGTATTSELVLVLRALGFRGESPPPTAHDRLNGGPIRRTSNVREA